MVVSTVHELPLFVVRIIFPLFPQAKPVVEEKPKQDSTEKRKASFKEKQEYEKLQSEIESLEKKKEEVSQQMNSSSTTDHKQLQTWADEIKKLTDQIDVKTSRWLELAELI